jgi:hypothetical protein
MKFLPSSGAQRPANTLQGKPEGVGEC